MSTARPADPFSRSRHLNSLWLGLLGPPAVWLAQFQTNYTLTVWVCTHGHRSLLTVVSAAALALIAIVALIAHRDWQMAGRGWPNAERHPPDRSRFLAVLGLLSSSLFALATLAQAIAQFFIDPCWQ